MEQEDRKPSYHELALKYATDVVNTLTRKYGPKNARWLLAAERASLYAETDGREDATNEKLYEALKAKHPDMLA